MGLGRALPGSPIGTEELVDRVERGFGLDIRRAALGFAEKLNVRERHAARAFATRHEAPMPGHGNPDLAAAALRMALDRAGLRVNDLAYLIGHTTTPARPVPPNITQVAELLGYDGPVAEFRQACTGFANALVMASGVLAGAPFGPVAIVGSEVGSVFFDPLRAAEDRAQLINLVQMGDGAGAIILGAEDDRPGPRLSRSFFGQIGLGRASGMALDMGGSDRPYAENRQIEFSHDFAAVRRTGIDLFRHGMLAAQSLGVDLDTVDRILPHQASGRIAEMIAAELPIPVERIFVNATHVGNTGSAAIWLGLSELAESLAPGTEVQVLGAEATKHMFGGFLYLHE